MKKITLIISAFLILNFGCGVKTEENRGFSQNKDTVNKNTNTAEQSEEPMFFEGYPQERVKAIEEEERLLEQSIKTKTDTQTYQSYVDTRTRWTPGQTVTVAFNGGDDVLRQKIENAVKAWTHEANIKFDFRNPSQPDKFREWTTFDAAYRADIRIAFESHDRYGLYWSAVGKESIKDYCSPESLARSCYFPNQSSMNLGGFTANNPSNWEMVVLHEFGHALGFLHEHQNPEGNCENEFDWDRVYTYYAQNDPPWDKLTVDFNLRKYPRQSVFEFSKPDSASIMKYHFKRFMFRDINVSRASGCYSEFENTTLSAQDKIAAADIYPRSSADIQRVLNERINVSNKVLKIKNLPAKVKEEIKENIKDIKNNQ